MAESNRQSKRFPIPGASMAQPHMTRTLERKSRFLAQCCHCANDAAAKEFVAMIRALRPDATHNCWAYVAGEPGDTAHIGSSDDGEPRGTAGRPMLNVLLHCGIGQICVVVSRWFGGIKLGAGGLARAYQDAVIENLASLPVAEAVERDIWTLRLPYDCVSRVHGLLPALEAVIKAEEYAESAILTLEAPADRAGEIMRAFSRATNGACFLRKQG